MSKESERVHVQMTLLDDLGFGLKPGATVLDLGCGSGTIVKEYRRLGYNGFGCDFTFKTGPDVAALEREGVIRAITREPYRLPFTDSSFDVVVSDEVFEHVQNYDETLGEIRRVLKPLGISVHFFPSRYTPIEPHVYVPLATIIQSRWWLAVWAGVGIRAPLQKGMSAREVADANHSYLTSRTNYLTRSAIERHVAKHFADYRFCESLFLKCSRRGRVVYRCSRWLPVLPRLYGTLRARVLFFRKGTELQAHRP